MTEILIIRHGQTPWNVKRLVQGWRDIEINDRGRQQAIDLARHLAQGHRSGEQPIDALYSSDLKRAVQTTELIDEALSIGFTVDSGIRERRYGVLEGIPFDRLHEVAPKEAKIWHSREPDGAIEGAETLREFQTRVVTALNALAARHVNERIAVVTHGGAMDIIWRQAAGVALEDPQRAILLNASINRIRVRPDGWGLIKWGEIEHLGSASDDDVTA